ncbi:MAG TPA: polyprenol monophosphomannose synthase [Chloroflexota bacterium]|nr:polyprenol monophosphomannose synthase [Chloroflexota bacterium]
MLRSPVGMSTLVVIPTFNEAANLPRLAAEILAHPDFSLLIVDDNSPDGTGIIADNLSEQYVNRLRVLHRDGKQGLGTAYIVGFREALRASPAYDFVIQMDADFSHNPADLPRLVNAANQADVAIGSRYVPGGGAVNWPLRRWLISRGGSLYTQMILGLPVRDPTSGFKCFRREALARIDLNHVHSTGFGFQVEMNWRCHRQGLRLIEVPICFVDRKLGESKMSGQIFFEAMLLVWRLRLEESKRLKNPEFTAS